MSRLLDDRGRLFGKINIIDILVVLLVVAVGVFIFLRVQGTGNQKVEVRARFAVEKVRKYTADEIAAEAKKGYQVRDDSGSLLGTLASVDVEPSPVEFPDSSGKPTVSPSGLFFDVFIEVKGTGQKLSSHAVRVGGTLLVVGKPITLRGAQFEVKATILTPPE
jgi:hypothetical protein